MATSDARTGATSAIRKKLNFHDEILWRKFSSRRLLLVESLSLSSKKACEQDAEIAVCAQTLQQEFGFPRETLPEFDKLVRLAIQSVRRNKKRSQKRLANRRREKEDRSSTEETASPIYSDLVNEDAFHGGTKSDDAETESKTAISALVAPMLHRPFTNSLRQLNMDDEFRAAADRLLISIKKSRTCYELTKSTARSFESIEGFGSACISSAVMFVLERSFGHLSFDSVIYIRQKLNSDFVLSSIIKGLDNDSLEVAQLGEFVAAQLFKKLVGGCVKDFGFNEVLYPVADIFRSILEKDYPFNPLPNPPARKSSILSRSPSSDTLITVVIRFNTKDLRFIYPSSSCSPPTVLELITNSKTAFGIVNNNRILKIRNAETKTLINSDQELEKLFDATKNKPNKLIELELIYHNMQDYLNLNFDTAYTRPQPAPPVLHPPLPPSDRPPFKFQPLL
ncbi:hypothetical protein KL930_004225 [Ogataea haglerorum]|uniref:Uncharacterized protein n=1 Tax=Ogataea haglerorum TaxID=1937702 RepID=A0AAN6D3E1_9ASCO|nr:hypothetical protein KL915_004335 [Ogataea haglerorum]KAG7704205.1 hypothetical protein KL914_004192 [Ogataea haglerorum]KAG7704390.1 hypothetical protein KL950_004197 [Ogataea haglerorum]KAG7725462.1 hypothetical protein KL933_004028 [Ogataea haglerorum]KAG7728250.1 hypothetical protein KL948_004117 [Ogataea haglerorum]